MAPSPLKIKASALTRLLKDISLYQGELEEQGQEVQRLSTSATADEEAEYELKKAKQLYAETEKMIPALKSKVKDFEKDLREYIAANKDTATEEELQDATKVLQKAETV